jgi:hypothetical protein
MDERTTPAVSADTSYKLRPRFRETTGSILISGLFTF